MVHDRAPIAVNTKDSRWAWQNKCDWHGFQQAMAVADLFNTQRLKKIWEI